MDTAGMDPALALEISAISRCREIEETIARGDSEVQQFYADAVIFITGGSGFLGKQLIEKLFRSCKIKKVFVLLRPKKQKTVQQRLEKILEDPVYDKLRQIQPDFVDKIVPVAGDITELRLGINDADWESLTEQVTVIFHGAATINFVETLKKATLTNIRGTREALLLGRACKNLRSYVHISTAYSNATANRVGRSVTERFYRSPVPPNTMIQLAEHLDEATLHEMTPKLLDVWPNTYSFTKAIAEVAVKEMSGDLPVCILRPAIVIAAFREPSPGWIDISSAFGPSGLILGIGLGILHTVYAKGNIKLDFVPVDLVNNAALIVGREASKHKELDPTIYTVTNSRNALVFNEIGLTLATKARTIPTEKAVWHAYCAETGNKYWYLFLTWLLHYIPGYLMDLVLLVLGKRPQFTKLYDKVFKLNTVFGYYMTNDWQFSDSNLLSLYKSLTPADRTIYNCDLNIINWKEYILIWCIGLRKYIIKDGLSNTVKGIQKQFWFKIVNIFVMALYIYILWKTLYMVYSIVSYVITGYLL